MSEGKDQETLAGLCEARPIGAGAACEIVSRLSSRAGLIRIESAGMAFSRRLDANSTGLDHIAIHIVASGSMMWRQFDTPRRVHPGSVVVTDLASEFGCTSGNDPAEWIVLLLNRHQIGSDFLAPLSDRPTILDSSKLLASALHAFIASFSEFLQHGGISGGPSDDELSTFGDAVTNVLRPLLQGSEPATQSRSSQSQSKVLQVCRFIDQRVASDALTPELLGRQFGLSRASLYRMFEPLGGVARYIRLQRIARAAAQLQTSDTRIALSAIAEASGFSSVDAFARAFRDCYGVTPREFRNAQPALTAAQRTVASWLERNYFWKTNAPRL